MKNSFSMELAYLEFGYFQIFYKTLKSKTAAMEILLNNHQNKS